MSNTIVFDEFSRRCKMLLASCDELPVPELENNLRLLREDFRNISDTPSNVEQARIAFDLTSSVITPRIPARA